ncbi:MAG TPA: TonB-dependent receptor [Casimicrobiaceae bacterium]|nr:TonB-dependent receptor [Casimicrobiaceae bacterium]
MRRKHVELAAGVAAAIAALGAATAQAADIRVEVTGSNIRRIEGEGALPVQTITREDIDRSGATNAVELMNLISANNSAGSVTIGNIIGSTTFANQTASRRGLGGPATLVLVNGKRLGTFSGGISGAEGVNLAAIPFAAVERVEVLKDGASAVYGSDAVAGVINFIMRSDFTGVTAHAYYGSPTRGGGGDQYELSGTFGMGDLAKDRYNAFFSVNYQEQKSLDQRDREFSRTSYLPDIGLNTTSGQSFPGFISTGGIGNPGFPDCGPYPGSIAIGARCRFDPSAVPGVQSIPNTKQLNLFGSARFQINSDWQAYATGLYSHQEVNVEIQPLPISDQIPTTFTPSGASEILLPPSSPFYPHGLAAAAGVDGEPLNVRYRCVECGNRKWTDTNEAWQTVLGARGTAWNWDFDGSFNYSQNTAKERPTSGIPLYSRILPLLNSGRVNLFGPNTPEISQEVRATDYTDEAFHAKLYGYGLDLKGSSEIYKLPAGPLALALGTQWFKENLTQNPAEPLQNGNASHYGGNLQNIDHSRTVYALFGELNVPIVQNLEGNVAVRWDHYDDFGSTTNPKVSLRWQPMRQLLLRASWGTGFLAPSLYQLFNPQTPGLSQAGVSDPLRCPNPNDPNAANNPDCNTQYTVTFGGNPSLKPEKSQQTTLGFVFEPVSGTSLGLDFFKIDLKDLVTNGVPIGTILDPTLQAQYANLVTRQASCPPSQFVPGAACPITAIDQIFVNLGEVKITGIDVDGRYTSPATAWGRVRASINGTYYIKYDASQPDGSFAGFVSNNYQAVATGVTPRWKHYASATWDYGPWSTTLGQEFQSSYIDVQLDPNGNTRRVGSMSLWDLQTSYTGFKNWGLTLGVKNLFDTNPPLTNSNLTFQSGYDPSYYDPRARFVYAKVTYSFH